MRSNVPGAKALRTLPGISLALAVSFTVGACATYTPRDSAPASEPPSARLPADAIPRREARSRYGNGPVYEVFGQRYEVLDSSSGYQAQGVASWYGKKFHGRLTASREPYDMYAMTAAHKSLPIPSYVEVRNLSNNKRIVVRVNDRGPFVDNRIIDLSYSAALKLDMVRDGTGLVEVTSISVDPPATATRAQPGASQRSTAPTALGKPAPAPAAAAGKATDARIYVQVGAFGDRDNAARRYRLLRDSGINQSFVHEEKNGLAALYRVRIGPIEGVAQYDKVVADLNRIGIGDTHLVSE